MRYSYKLILVLLSLFFVHSLPAQDCRDVLRRAVELYEKGHLNEVREVLADACIQVLPTEKDKEEAYYLLAVANLYMKNLDSAKVALLTILRKNPEYVCKQKSPLGFQKYYETFKTTPAFIIGGSIGLNTSEIKSIKAYTLDQANVGKEGTYKKVFGFQAHGTAMLPLTPRIYLVGEFGFKHFAYEFENTQFGYSKVRFRERQNWLELPAMIRYNFGNPYVFKDNKKFIEKLNPYIVVGASGTFLLGSTALAFRQDDAKSDRALDLTSQVNMNAMRHTWGYYAIVGGGMEYKNGRAIWSLACKYTIGLADVVKSKTRYDNQNLLFSYGYIDSDIKFRNLTFSLGLTYPIYNPRQHKKFHIEDLEPIEK